MSSSSTSSSEAWNRARIRVAGFLVGLVFVTAALYGVGGLGRKDLDGWFKAVPRSSGSDTTRILFVGSSHVAAGIDTAVFDSVAGLRAAHPVRSWNLGSGYTTIHQIYFGVRWIARRDPGFLRGAKIALEAPAGLPDHADWTDPWMSGGFRMKLSPYLDPSDLPRLWKSDLGIPDKVLLGAETVLGLRNNFWRLRLVALARTEGILSRLHPPAGGGAPMPPLDISPRGGINTEAARLPEIRQLARVHAAEDASGQKPWRDWDRSVLHDLDSLVRSCGGELVLFEMPLSSVQRGPLRTPVREADRSEFDRYASERRIAVVPADTIYPDPCFPDLWHMSIPTSKDFSMRLALRMGKTIGAAPAGR